MSEIRIGTDAVAWTAPTGRGATPFTLALPELQVAAGELVAITGPTRCGKTVALHLLAGWLAPSAGAVAWPGAPDAPPPWSHVAVVPQRLALLDELSIIENVRFPLLTAPPADGTDVEDRLADVVARLDLGRLLDRAVDELSIGERQRVMVARALAGRPPILLADEPTAHQDERREHATLDLLAESAAAGAAVVIATREPSIAARATTVIHLGS